MNENPDQLKRHPELYTAEEAVEYLRLDSSHSLETIKKNYGLKPLHLGKQPVFHRKDMDEAVEKALRGEAKPHGRGNGKNTKL
jgi:hypothetical protein